MDNNQNNKCRICLKSQNSSDLKSILTAYSITEFNADATDNNNTNINQSITIYEMLQFVIGGDCKTSVINHKEITGACKDCIEKLMSSYTFRKMCLNAEKILLNVNFDVDGGDIKEERIYEEYLENDGTDIETLEISDELEKLEELDEDDPDNNDVEHFKPIQKNLFTNQSNDVKMNKKKLRCRSCNKTFMQPRDYQMHYRQMHTAKKLCTLCGKLIASEAMTKHLITHTATKNFLCTECGKNFISKDTLRKHLRIHGDDKRYVCEHCGERFIHWNSKRSHIQTIHTATDERKYQCTVCSKRFAHNSNMVRHLRLHTGDRRHECTYCHKKFLTTTELRNHLVVHTHEKKEICTTCDKTFGTKKGLKTHMQIHTGERNYLCTICNKSFSQAQVLRTHLLTHPNSTIPPPGTILSQKALLKQSQKVFQPIKNITVPKG